MKTAAPLFALALLAACGQSSTPAENKADQLDAAAAQSTPEAAAVLHNEADAIEANNSADATGAEVQNALQNAGNAQAGNAQ